MQYLFFAAVFFVVCDSDEKGQFSVFSGNYGNDVAVVVILNRSNQYSGNFCYHKFEDKNEDKSVPNLASFF